MNNEQAIEVLNMVEAYGLADEAKKLAIKALQNERPQGEWIPIKYRPITNEERKEIAEHYGIENCDTIEEKTFDCPMPEDGQRSEERF